MPDAVIHVVDDDTAMRESLEFLLATAGFGVRLYESADALLGELTPDATGIVLTDLRMPGTDGLHLLRRMTAGRVSLPVVVMTGHGDVPLAVEAMKLGAVDFIEKPFDDEILMKAIRAAREQSARSSDPVLAEFRHRLCGLSTRERQVFDGLIAGHANKVIARNLAISPRTVEVYRANVMTKMEVGSVSELVRLAVKADRA